MTWTASVMTASASCTGRFLASMPMMQTATYSRRQDDDVVYLGGPQLQSHRGVISSGGTPPKWPRLRRPRPRIPQRAHRGQKCTDLVPTGKPLGRQPSLDPMKTDPAEAR